MSKSIKIDLKKSKKISFCKTRERRRKKKEKEERRKKKEEGRRKNEEGRKKK